MYLHLILDISQKYLQVRVHYDKISWGQLYGYGRVGEYRRYSLFLILGTLLLSEKLSEVTKDTGDTYPLTCLYLILDIF